VATYEDEASVGTAGLPDDSLAALFKATGFLQKLLKLMSLVEDPKEDWFSNVNLFKVSLNSPLSCPIDRVQRGVCL